MEGLNYRFGNANLQINKFAIQLPKRASKPGTALSSAMLAPLNEKRRYSDFMASFISNRSHLLLLPLSVVHIQCPIINMGHQFARMESKRKQRRRALVSGKTFEQSHFLQLYPKIIFLVMAYAIAMHWLLGEAFSAVKTVCTDLENDIEHFMYFAGFNFH
jgi:hypothetical protein